MKCYSCGEYDGVTLHHGHDEIETDCYNDDGETMCHSVCGNCDHGLCELCE